MAHYSKCGASQHVHQNVQFSLEPWCTTPARHTWRLAAVADTKACASAAYADASDTFQYCVDKHCFSPAEPEEVL
jgi:hypothetical protein